MNSWRIFLRPALLMCLLLAIPIVPFLLFGSAMEAWARQWLNQQPPTAWVVLAVIGLLSGDILLPTPSSLISTMAGWQLGSPLGALASWIGMSLGAIVGFVIARRWGRVVALRFTGEEELAHMESLTHRFGAAVLVFCRGVPVLAEASVLLMGINRLSWRAFLPPILLSNLGLSLAYAYLGSYSQSHGWLPLALGVSVALPVLLASLARWWMRGPSDS